MKIKETKEAVLIVVCLLFFSNLSEAQYWFGPKVGGNYSSFIYQSAEFETDSFSISPTYNFELGGVFIYQATDMFSVQGEIFYERLRRDLENRNGISPDVVSNMTYHFISVPINFRVSFGNEPIHYYLSGGIKMKFWTGGNGFIQAGEPEFGDEGSDIKKIVFRQSKSDVLNGVYAVPDANIMQFGLSVGGGVYLDLRTNGRLLFDARYTFGHSNMGFNNNQDFVIGVTGYSENFAHRANTISLSLAYLFQYDVKLQSKGMSTSKESNKAHKKKKR